MECNHKYLMKLYCKIIHPKVGCWPILTFLMRRLISSNKQECKKLLGSPKPSHVGIHWKALAKYIWVPLCQGFRHFSAFCHHFILAKLVTSFKSEHFLFYSIPLTFLPICVSSAPEPKISVRLWAMFLRLLSMAEPGAYTSSCSLFSATARSRSSIHLGSNRPKRKESIITHSIGPIIDYNR